jgi:hypothetical protein
MWPGGAKLERGPDGGTHDERAEAIRMAGDSDPRSGSTTEGSSSAWKVGTWVVAAVLVGWFFVAWLALDRHVLDAAGESVGTAFALGVLVSVIGAVRASRD